MIFGKVIFEDSEWEDGKDHKPYSKIKYVAVIKAEVLKSIIVGGIKAEKLKGILSNGGLNSENIKLFLIEKSKSPEVRLWALRVAYMLVLWTIAVQFIRVDDKFTPSLFLSRSAYSLPPQSTYIFFYVSFLCIEKTSCTFIPLILFSRIKRM